MATKPTQRPQVLIVVMLLSLAVAIWFLWPWLFVLSFSALMAWVFYPVFLRFARRGHRVKAAILTLIVTILVILIPLGFIIVAAIGQLAAFAEVLAQYAIADDFPPLLKSALDSFNHFMMSVTGVDSTLSTDQVAEFIRTSLPALAHAVGDRLAGVLAGIPALVVGSVIYMFTFVEFLLYGPQIIKNLEAVSPFDKAVTRRYFDRIGMMSTAMVKGQLFISMILSAIAAALLIPLGYGNYFFILFIIFTILNYIPLGCGIIMVPLCLVTMFTGQFWQSIVVLVLYFASGNLDAPLRAHFIPKKIQLSIGLTLMASFCGIAYFGFLGVVYGPVIMIVLLTTFDMYAESRTVS